MRSRSNGLQTQLELRIDFADTPDHLRDPHNSSIKPLGNTYDLQLRNGSLNNLDNNSHVNVEQFHHTFLSQRTLCNREADEQRFSDLRWAQTTSATTAPTIPATAPPT